MYKKFFLFLSLLLLISGVAVGRDGPFPMAAAVGAWFGNGVIVNISADLSNPKVKSLPVTVSVYDSDQNLLSTGTSVHKMSDPSLIVSGYDQRDHHVVIKVQADDDSGSGGSFRLILAISYVNDKDVPPEKIDLQRK